MTAVQSISQIGRPEWAIFDILSCTCTSCLVLLLLVLYLYFLSCTCTSCLGLLLLVLYFYIKKCLEICQNFRVPFWDIYFQILTHLPISALSSLNRLVINKQWFLLVVNPVHSTLHSMHLLEKRLFEVDYL